MKYRCMLSLFIPGSKAIRQFLFLTILAGALVSTAPGQEKQPEGKIAPPKAITVEMAEDGRQFEFLAFSPDSSMLVYSLSHVLGKEQPVMVFYDLKERKKIKTLSGPDPNKLPLTPVFLPGGKQMIAGSYGARRPYLLDWQTGKYTPFECADSESSSWNPGGLTVKGDLLVGFGSDNNPGGGSEFHVWQVASGKKVSRFGGQHGAGGFQLSEDGQFLVAEHGTAVDRDARKHTMTWLRCVRVWNLPSGKEVGLISKPKEITFDTRLGPPESMLKEFLGSACRCRVRISPAGKIMVVPVFPREMVLEVEGNKAQFLSVRELATRNQLVDFEAFPQGGGLLAFALSPDHKTLFASGYFKVGARRLALVIWDVSAYQGMATHSKPQLSPAQIGELWATFAKKDPMHAYRALRQLAAVPEQSLPYLKQNLKPAPDRSPEIAKLLSQLADVQSSAKAKEKLVEIGDEALPVLTTALKGSASEEKNKTLAGIVAMITKDTEPNAKTRQALWTIELLEFMASAEALAFLGEFAQGSSAAWLTQEARASIQRIKNRI